MQFDHLIKRIVLSPTIRNYILAIALGAFPALVLLQCALFYVLPFLVPLITGAAVFIYGVVLSVAVLWRRRSKRIKAQELIIGLVAMTWLVWIFLPTKEFSVRVRFWLEKSRYDHVVAQVARGGQPGCLATHDCMFGGAMAPYVVFPFPGFLSGWIGVVHVPELNQAPDIERLKSVASDPSCDSSPIAAHYYVCVFY